MAPDDSGAEVSSGDNERAIDYLARVRNSVEQAESHLEVPFGTIWSIPNEPDFIAVVKTHAVIEPILTDVIVEAAKQSSNENYRDFVATLNMSGGPGKLRLAKVFGVLDDDTFKFIAAVAEVRNRYAHNVKNMHLSLSDILAKLQPNHGRIVEHLTGRTTPTSDNTTLKWSMYFRLADYLADALMTLKPPPSPDDSFLRALLNNLPPKGGVAHPIHDPDEAGGRLGPLAHPRPTLEKK
jgi:hypothetical protein